MTLFDDALLFAVEKHSGAVRKKSTLPYIVHPIEVATIAATLTEDPEVLAAAVLHDTVEDTGATAEEIEARFGRRVAMLVASETENKRPEMDASASWRIRKEESLRILAEAEDPGVKIVWLSDKLSNMRSFYRAWLREGNALWKAFHQSDPVRQAWYYRSICALTDEWRDTPAWTEYHRLVETVFAGIRSDPGEN